MKRPAGLLIRRATPGDAALLAELGARTFSAAFGAGNRPEDLALHLSTYYTAEVIARGLMDPGSETLLAEMHGSAAGYAELVRREPPLPLGEGGRMLSRFYLEPAWIGRGIAGPLMDAVLDAAAQGGAPYLWLTVWQKNPRAVAFYEKCGFLRRGTTTFTVGTDPQEDWVMSRPVEASLAGSHTSK